MADEPSIDAKIDAAKIELVRLKAAKVAELREDLKQAEKNYGAAQTETMKKHKAWLDARQSERNALKIVHSLKRDLGEPVREKKPAAGQPPAEAPETQQGEASATGEASGEEGGSDD